MGSQPALKRAAAQGNIDGWLRRSLDLVSLAEQAEQVKEEARRRLALARRNLVSLGAQIAADPRAAIQGRARAANVQPKPASAKVARSGPSFLSVPNDQILAGARGAQDAFTLGAGDVLYAGGRALVDKAHGANWGDAWGRRWAAERARDEYDRQHYRTARNVGQVAGTVAGLAATGGMDALLYGGGRIAQATPMAARELAALSGVGAAGGVAVQGATDLQRGRLGSAGDYVGAALGGAATAGLSRYGAPGIAGAAGGATASVAQDVLNGRQPSLQNAARAAQADGYLAGGFGIAGRAWSNGLSIREKGALGEALGRMRTRLNGDQPLPGHPRLKVNGGRNYTVVDHMTKRDLITEQKFGENARLSPNQKAALKENPDRYRVDGFLPRDVGAIVAYPYGLLGYQEFGR